MEQVRLVTDSTADIPDELAEELGIGVVYDYINFGTESLRDKIDITRTRFYSRLTTSAELPTTASPGVGEFEQAYRQAGAPDTAVVSIHPPAALSALYNSAQLAAQAFPEGCVTVVDSGQVTMGMGWMVIAAAKAALVDASVDQILRLVAEMKRRTHVVAALDTFEYLRRSGRVGWAQSVVGTLLRIKPMVQVKESQILPLDRVRTRRRAMSRIVELTESLAPLESAAILHTNWPDGAEELQQLLSQVAVKRQILTVDVTPVIGVHVGPQGIGVAVVTVGDSAPNGVL